MNFTHVFISRPRQQAEELASMVKTLHLHPVVQPAFHYFPLDARSSQAEIFDEMDRAGAGSLLIFTSPRSVTHGLSQLPANLTWNARVAAIGPATARALADAGVRVGITPVRGYTSEALLETLSSEDPARIAGGAFAFIVAAAGGRQKLLESLEQGGWRARLLKVYRPEPAELDKTALEKLKEASGVLSIWTSANAMKALSQRLPPAAWFQLCQGDWLVISDRLKRLARAYGPERIHLAAGPGNADLLAAIRNLG